jgi:beta-lactamase class A
MQVARFYYLLVTDNLVTPEHSRKMREILAGSELNHKFVRALRKIDPEAAVSRKSGSWSTYHSDSVLVERDGHHYIAVALSNNADGSQWLGRIITELDALLDRDESAADQRSLGANQAVR